MRFHIPVEHGLAPAGVSAVKYGPTVRLDGLAVDRQLAGMPIMPLQHLDDMHFTLADFDRAWSVIRKHLSPSPQIRWPLLCERSACEVWVKHENHLPTGVFKIRGGLWYTENMVKGHREIKGVVAATRGNHGQSVALASRIYGTRAVVVVPYGNSVEKNRAMVAYGAELIEHGRDFHEALDYARQLAHERALHMFPSFHPLLVQGVGTYGVELLSAVGDLHTVYVPIGLGSGICGMIAARDALNLTTEVVGVVAANAPAYALSFRKGDIETTDTADTLADGLAVRVPHKPAFDVIHKGASRIVEVSEEELSQAIRTYFTDTHNIAEGAAAAPLAALLNEKAQMEGKRVALVLSGGNVDWETYSRIVGSDIDT